MTLKVRVLRLCLYLDRKLKSLNFYFLGQIIIGQFIILDNSSLRYLTSTPANISVKNSVYIFIKVEQLP